MATTVETNNITTLSIVDQDLYDRVAGLLNYRDPSLPDFSGQRAAGAIEALNAFNASKGQDPALAVPTRPDAWKAILVYSTLVVIFEGDGSEEARRLEDHYQAKMSQAITNFIYRYDEDESGELDDNDPAETGQRVRELVIQR